MFLGMKIYLLDLDIVYLYFYECGFMVNDSLL